MLWRPRSTLLELADQVVAAQTVQSAGYLRLRAMLGAEQLRVVDDEHPLVAVCTGRRSGKTTSAIGKTVKAFDRRPGSRVAYFAPTEDQGEGIIWEDIRLLNLRFGLGLKEHASDGWWTRGSCRLELFGYHTQRQAEAARGRKFDLVIIDESQLGKPWFAKFLDEAVFPTTLDYHGQVLLLGTPGEVPDGYFFDAVHDTTGVWSNDHHWTCERNPFFAGRDPLAEVRAKYKYDGTEPKYRREWLGLWVIDPDALVYYIPDEAVRSPPPGTAWHSHVIGLDLGWKDHDAIAAMSIEHLRQWSHLRHIETVGQQTNHQLFARLLQLQEHFPGAPVVFDPAGHAVRKTIETFRVDAPKIMWVPADKARKVEYIDLLNSDLKEDKTFVEPASLMLKEARRLRWKRPGKVAEDADHSDPGDAWLYSWRHARDALRELPQKKPRRPDDPFEQERERLKAQPTGQSYFRQRRGEVDA